MITEHNCRCGISDADRQDRLGLNPIIFHKINHLWGTLEVNLFASHLSAQCQHYFSWVGGQIHLQKQQMHSSRHGKGACQPTLEHGGQALSQAQTQEVATMVYNSVTDAHRLPLVNIIRPSSDVYSGPFNKTSCMAYLRER